MDTDLYAVLGVPPNATNKAIQQRYHYLAKKYHPDRNPSSTRFSEITAAYSVLKDPHKRVLYNLYGRNGLLFAEMVDFPPSHPTLPAESCLLLTLSFLTAFVLELFLNIPLLSIIAFPPSGRSSTPPSSGPSPSTRRSPSTSSSSPSSSSSSTPTTPSRGTG